MTDYPRLLSAATDASTALQAAIEADKQEASNFWVDLKSRLRDLWNYDSEKSRFEAEAASLIARAERAVSDCRVLVESLFKPHEGKTDRLLEDRTYWAERSTQTMALANQVATLAHVEGWRGPAQQDYANAVLVQTRALQELSGVMQGAANGAENAAVLNGCVFGMAFEAINEGVSKAQDGERAGSNGYYYLRTAWWGDVFTALPDVLRQISQLASVEAAVDELKTELNTSLVMGNLLKGENWPSGLEAAGVEPADLRDIVTKTPPDAGSFDLPVSRTPGVCMSGALR